MASQESSEPPLHQGSKFKKILLGPAKNLRDPWLLHKLALIPFFAWIGLGADGLSSSAYGPEEAYRSLTVHTYLAVFLVIATIFTVSIISFSYSKIIEQFPGGGGGYIVATKLLGKSAGVISGCALFIDYILTITVSIAGGGDALFSLLPVQYHIYKLPVEFAAIGILTLINLRGVKESVILLMPIFIIFVITHILLIGTSIYVHLADISVMTEQVNSGFASGVKSIGIMGMLLIFFRAYSLGGGTYTGIEAVSNAVGVLKEPKVKTAKRTMLYMAVSLALTAGGLLLCYLISHINPVDGQTLNAVLSKEVFKVFDMKGFNSGTWLSVITVISEAVLLLVAAQTGFIDGPRILSNMATDGWFPKRFAFLSDRLTMRNGIFVIGFASGITLFYTSGHIEVLVVMYSINVFLTFSLSQLGMMRFWKQNRQMKSAIRNFGIHLVTFVLCAVILIVMIIEKFADGAWVTVIVTTLTILLCFSIRKHYANLKKKIEEIDTILMDLPEFAGDEKDILFDEKKPTAAVLVENYNGLGIHIFMNIVRLFRKSFNNVLFISVGSVDSELFKETNLLEQVSSKTKASLEKYTDLSKRLGFPARYVYDISTDVVEAASELCIKVSKTYPRTVFFAGELIFENAKWYHRLLHNQTAYAILRRIRFSGLPMVMVPAKIMDKVY